MRIGIVTQWADCGAGYVSRAYQETLSAENDVFIFARGSRRQSTGSIWDQPRVHWAGPHPCVSGFKLAEFRRWVHRNGIQVVLFNEQRWWEGVLESQRLGLLTGAYIDYYTAETVPLFRLFDFLICNTRRHRSVFSDHPQCQYVPWGTDVRLFCPSGKPETPTTKVRFFTNSGRGGINARSDPSLDRRGTEFILAAMPAVKGNCELIIHSQCGLGECPGSWQDAVRKDSRIMFIEKTVGPPGLYSLGTVYVYPSRLDGIGLTLPEALASGLPAITTASPPMTEFVQDGFNGRTVRIERSVCRHDGYYWPESLVDVRDLACVMQDYVDNPDVVSQHSGRARERAVQTLDWRRNSARLSEIVGSQRKLVNLDEQEFSDLLRRAQRYDCLRQPTPVQQCLIGLKRYLRTHWRPF
jgi:1,2-diacylglycerol 3-alpha-glucosyltransferase